MTRPDEMTEVEKKADDELGRIWADAVKARLVNRAKGLAPAVSGIIEPPWVTRAQARIDVIYEANKGEIRFDVVDQIVAEEKNSEAGAEVVSAHTAHDDDALAHLINPNGETKPPKKEKHKRVVDDQYFTPAWVIARFLDTEEAGNLPGGPWLEPTAGAGAIIKAVNSYFDGIEFHAVELREEHEEGLSASGAATYEIGDFLNVAVELLQEWVTARPDPIAVAGTEKGIEIAFRPKRFTVGIGNPPFGQAFEIIERMFPLCQHVILLLRLNFLEGEARADWMREHTPDVFVLPNRPSFIGEGTDRTAYAWFWWDTSRAPGAAGKVKVLASTPKADRK